jgi:hypothetical protein
MPQKGDHLKSDNLKLDLTLVGDQTVEDLWADAPIDLKFTFPLDSLKVETEADWIMNATDATIKLAIFGYPLERFTLHGKSRLGLSWDAVANMMNTRLREEGVGLLAELFQTKKFRFRHLLAQFEIRRMSYNFSVLLGFYGTAIDPEHPLRSQELTYTDHYLNAPVAAITDFQSGSLIVPFLTAADQSLLGTIPITITTSNGYPPVCKVLFTIDEWISDPDNKFINWLKLNPSTGSFQLVYISPPDTDAGDTAYVKINVELYQGDNQTPLFRRRVEIRGENAKSTEYKLYVLHPAKNRIVFDEKIRVGIEVVSGAQAYDDVTSVTWSIPDRKLLRFASASDNDGN